MRLQVAGGRGGPGSADVDGAEAGTAAPLGLLQPTGRADQPSAAVVGFDPEPLELYGGSAGAGSSQGRALWPTNPKNGTPWYREKRVSERGTSSHSHFGDLEATGTFKGDVERAHNAVREYAGLAPLTWSTGLAALAAKRVRKLAEDGCYIRHSPLDERWNESGFQYVGENLYKVINMAPTGVDVVDAWYAEIEDYSYGPVGATCTKQRCASRAQPPCTLGHFTQVMWAESTHVGCARAECPGEEQPTFVAVCHYGPGGNIVGRVPFPPVLSEAIGLSAKACSLPAGWPSKTKEGARAAGEPAALRGAAPRLSLRPLSALLAPLALAVAAP